MQPILPQGNTRTYPSQVGDPRPRLSWNEIESRAVAFAARWAGETYEKGESQSFWSEFLTVFGIDRRRHGAFG